MTATIKSLTKKLSENVTNNVVKRLDDQGMSLNMLHEQGYKIGFESKMVAVDGGYKIEVTPKLERLSI